MKYTELNKKQQSEVNKLPIMFAFSNEQFEKGMRDVLGLEPHETDKIYKLGNTGGFYKKSDAKLVRETFSRHADELKEAMKDDDFVVDMFEYEMGNHEYQPTYNEEEVLYGCGLNLEDMDERLERLWNQAKTHYLKLCDENN